MQTRKIESSDGVFCKVALIQRGFRQCDAVQLANEKLPAEFWLTETTLSKIITGRQRVKPEQAKALAAVLDCPVEEIFPDLGNNSSNVRKAEGGES